MALYQDEIAKINAMDARSARAYVQSQIEKVKGNVMSKGLAKDYEGILATIPTEEELQLADLQKQYITDLTTIDPEEQKILDQQQTYYDMMLADSTLSPEEEAMFEEEYSKNLAALEEQFGYETGKLGARQMAEQVAAGTFGTTTGERATADTQRTWAESLSSNIAQLGEAKEAAKSDMDAAKRQMAQQGYALTESLFQQDQSNALNAALGLQSYYSGLGAGKANYALNQALMLQASERATYNRNMAGWAGITGLGTQVAGSAAAGYLGGK